MWPGRGTIWNARRLLIKRVCVFGTTLVFELNKTGAQPVIQASSGVSNAAAWTGPGWFSHQGTTSTLRQGLLSQISCCCNSICLRSLWELNSHNPKPNLLGDHSLMIQKSTTFLHLDLTSSPGAMTGGLRRMRTASSASWQRCHKERKLHTSFFLKLFAICPGANSWSCSRVSSTIYDRPLL